MPRPVGSLEVEDVDWSLGVGPPLLRGYQRCSLGGRIWWVTYVSSPRLTLTSTDGPTAALQAHSFSTKDLTIKGPSIRTCIGILIFILASGVQHDCHAYLASLKKPRRTAKGEMKIEYRLPEHPVFNLSLTPHYFAECLIYLSLSILAAPEGEWLNWTLVSALVFVAVNLGVTANGTRKWYAVKFGTETVKGRARMIPGLY